MRWGRGGKLFTNNALFLALIIYIPLILIINSVWQLCGLCLGIPGFKLIVGFLMLQSPVALLGIRRLRAFALLSLRPRNTMALPVLHLFADVFL